MSETLLTDIYGERVKIDFSSPNRHYYQIKTSPVGDWLEAMFSAGGVAPSLKDVFASVCVPEMETTMLHSGVKTYLVIQSASEIDEALSKNVLDLSKLESAVERFHSYYKTVLALLRAVPEQEGTRDLKKEAIEYITQRAAALG